MKNDAYWNAFWSRLPRGAAPLEGSGWLSDKPRHQVVKAVDSRWLSAPAKVLDVGCGVGNTAAWLAGLSGAGFRPGDLAALSS